MELPAEPHLQRIAAQSWALRARVEREAAARFSRFAQALSQCGAPDSLVELAGRAAEDEGRHVGLCSELAESLGADPLPADAGPPAELAPSRLTPSQKLTYEVVAACCVAETESMGTLAALLSARPLAEVRQVLHAIARDEVRHAQLGWGYLAWVQPRGEASFVEALIPLMFKPAEELFQPPLENALESPELPRWGVLPHSRRREVFVSVLQEVVFPGLEHLGVGATAARAWLATRVVG